MSLWFISTRKTHSDRSGDLDIYRADRGAGGAWSVPVRLPDPVNSDSAEWFPRPAADGWLYFGSRRPGGQGKDDIWRAREAHRRWTVENVAGDINSAGAEYELQPAPDGRWGILSTDNGLYRVVPTKTGWRRDRRYDASINGTGTEIGPMIAPDGQSFVFSRDAGDGRSGELFFAATSTAPASDHCSRPVGR